MQRKPRKSVPSMRRGRALAVLLGAALGAMAIVIAASRTPAERVTHDDTLPGEPGGTQITGPGPGIGATVYYDPTTGEIHALVLYDLSNPVPPSPQSEDVSLDVTNDPNYPALFDEFRSGVVELSWHVDLETLTLKHR